MSGIKGSKKIGIISGVTGQDGSYLAEYLLSLGYVVIGIKRRTSSICTERVDHIFDNPNFILEYGDLTDAVNIWRLIEKYKPDEVYNIGAQSHVKVSFDVPENTIDTIVKATLHFMEAIRTLSPTTRFYQASSSEMFGTTPPPQNEETRFCPASPYACAKLMAHNLVGNYRESYGIFACSGILFNHESPRRGETFVTRKITMAAARINLGLQEKLYLGNLDAKRDWGHARDYVRAMHAMLQMDHPDDYVVATGKSYSVREFLNTVFEIAGLSIDEHVEIDERLFRPQEVDYLLGDPTRAKSMLSWEPEYDMYTMAKEMYESDLKIVAKELK